MRSRPHRFALGPGPGTDLALLATAAIWGGTFVVVKTAIVDTGVFTFLGWRFLLGAGLLAAVYFRELRVAWSAELLRWGTLAGVFLWLGYALQTLGLERTTATNAGFITGLNVLMVPFLAWGVTRHRPGGAAFAGAACATVGTVLMVGSQTSLSWLRGFSGTAGSATLGDLLVLGCAVAFAAHIVILGLAAPRLAVGPLAVIQILVTGILSTAAALMLESPSASLPLVAVRAVVLTGVFATALAFLVQTGAQRFTSPTRTAIIFASEPLFAALTAYGLVGEKLEPAGIGGAGLILGGILIAEAGRRRPPGAAPVSSPN